MVIFFVLLSLFCCLVCFAALAASTEKKAKVILVITGAFLVVVLMFTSMKVGMKNQSILFAKDVDLHQVAVKGISISHAQIRIYYEDGKLDSVMLIPNTTITEK